MARKVFDAAAVVGKYTDKNGEIKQRWLNVGAVFENEKGLSLKLEALPISIPEGGLWIKFFPPKDQQKNAVTKGSTGIDDDPDLPF